MKGDLEIFGEHISIKNLKIIHFSSFLVVFLSIHFIFYLAEVKCGNVFSAVFVLTF